MSDADLLSDLPDDPDAALAAEYVLRLLDPAEEAACAARVARDPAFADAVARWRGALSALDAGFAPVAPPPGLQARIEARLFGARPSALVRMWESAALWRAVAAAAVVAAVVLGRPSAPVPAPDLVAGVAAPDGSVHLVALVDRAAGTIRFSHLAGAAAPGRSLELWVLPAGAAAPASLGVVPAAARFAVPIPLDAAAALGPGTAIIVSDEVAGGSPTGQPQGAVLAQGAVSEL